MRRALALAVVATAGYGVEGCQFEQNPQFGAFFCASAAAGSTGVGAWIARKWATAPHTCNFPKAQMIQVFVQGTEARVYSTEPTEFAPISCPSGPVYTNDTMQKVLECLEVQSIRDGNRGSSPSTAYYPPKSTQVSHDDKFGNSSSPSCPDLYAVEGEGGFCSHDAQPVYFTWGVRKNELCEKDLAGQIKIVKCPEYLPFSANDWKADCGDLYTNDNPTVLVQGVELVAIFGVAVLFAASACANWGDHKEKKSYGKYKKYSQNHSYEHPHPTNPESSTTAQQQARAGRSAQQQALAAAEERAAAEARPATVVVPVAMAVVGPAAALAAAEARAAVLTRQLEDERAAREAAELATAQALALNKVLPAGLVTEAGGAAEAPPPSTASLGGGGGAAAAEAAEAAAGAAEAAAPSGHGVMAYISAMFSNVGGDDSQQQKDTDYTELEGGTASGNR